MQYEEMRELLRELVAKYIHTKLAWVGEHQTTDGFDEWFTQQVGIKMAREDQDDE